MQNFSGFASLHRADLTHEPQPLRSVHWGRIALVAIAGVTAAVVLHVLANW